MTTFMWTGITFSKETAIVPDTVEFIKPFSDSLIITIAGNTARITFPDTVIIAVDSTKSPNNPASTAIFGGARLTMRNYRVSPYPWTYYLLGGSKEQLSVWQGTQTSEVGFCGSTRGSQIYFYPTEYLTYGGRSANITTRPDGTQEYRIADHLGSNRVTLENTGSVVTTTDYEPYGKAIAGVPPRKGFIDKEKDQESNLGDFGVRKYDDGIGRFTSIDPLTEKMPSWSPYVYSFNSPLVLIDPNGRFPGDYYDVDGNHLGDDGIDDDKIYIADEKNADGSFSNAQELSITHTEFRKQASTVYGESSAYKMNSVTGDLKKEMFSIASVHQKNNLAYGANSDKAKEYLGLTPSQINGSKFKTTANAAVINAVTGGFDYSNGAIMWDGREQALFPASDNRRSTGSFELHMNTMGWNISDSHYSTWKANIGSAFQAPQQKAAPANFGNYRNKGLMRLHSTAVYGETIFWEIK